MNKTTLLMGGLGLGAGVMYFYDPDLGRRRRAVLLDQLQSMGRHLECRVEGTMCDLSHRAQGFVSETRSLFSADDVSDDVLAERVRAHMGHCISRPRSIAVSVRDGKVTLTGPILETEAGALIACVRAVRGIKCVENRLSIKYPGELAPSPQNHAREKYSTSYWSPSTRLVASLAGGMLVALGLTQRFPVACVLGTVGLGLAARAVTNSDLTRFVSRGGRGTPVARESRAAQSHSNGRHRKVAM